MNKEIAKKLWKLSRDLAEMYSNPNRRNNVNGELFSVECVKPLSEYTAMIRFNKSTGKRALAFAYYINSGTGRWEYFFPKESHVYGMQKVSALLQEVEEFNLPQNEV